MKTSIQYDNTSIALENMKFPIQCQREWTLDKNFDEDIFGIINDWNDVYQCIGMNNRENIIVDLHPYYKSHTDITEEFRYKLWKGRYKHIVEKVTILYLNVGTSNDIYHYNEDIQQNNDTQKNYEGIGIFCVDRNPDPVTNVFYYIFGIRKKGNKNEK